MQQRTLDVFPQTKFPFGHKQCERDCFPQDVVVKLPLGRVCCPVATSAQGTMGQMWMRGTWQLHGLSHSGQVPTAQLFSFCKLSRVNCKLAINLLIKKSA